MTFSEASPVGQTAKPQGGQADGGSNLLQVRSQRAGCSWKVGVERLWKLLAGG